MRERKKKIGRSQLLALRGLLMFLLFFVLNILMENRDQFEADGSSCEIVHADATPYLYETVYPWFTNQILGKTTSGRVSVIFIPENLVEVQQNLCRGRAYVASLIKVLAEEQPAAIVIDKYFSAKSCLADGSERDSTALLLNAVQFAQSRKIPLVVGEATDTAAVRAADTCLLANPDFLAFSKSDDVPRGLTKLNSNREQIPLRWRVLDPPSAIPGDQTIQRLPGATSATFHDRDSLALTTVQIVAPETIASSQFQTTLHAARQPYARLDLKLSTTPSTDLLCSGNSPYCSPLLIGDAVAPFGRIATHDAQVQGKVVLVGSRNAVDRWVVLDEHRWGYELQAEYIDALLSGKYLRAVPGHWIFALSVLFVFFLEAVPPACEYMHCFEKSPWLNSHTTPSEIWVWIWSLLFVAIVLAFCLLQHFLPPLSVLIAALTTMVTRGVFDRMDYFENRIVAP